MASSDKYEIIEVQPSDHLPTVEIWGTQWTIPTSSLNTTLLFLLCLAKIHELVKSSTKGIKLAMTALDRMDIKIIDAMDDLAVEMRETTNADRVVFFLLHNGVSNMKYHWKRLSAMSESARIGVRPVMKELRDILVPSIITETDYDLYRRMRCYTHFVQIDLNNTEISRKHKNFILETGMFSHYIRVLVDEDTRKPYGAVLIQYSTHEQCVKEWSQHTYDTVETKLDLLYNLFAKRTGSDRFRFLSKVKEFMRFGR